MADAEIVGAPVGTRAAPANEPYRAKSCLDRLPPAFRVGKCGNRFALQYPKRLLVVQRREIAQMRKLTAIGFALVAILAMSAVAATAAHAEQEGHFTTTDLFDRHANALVTADDQAQNLVLEKPDGSTTTCVEDVFHGTVPGTAKTLTIEPTFGGSNKPRSDGPCVSGELPATIEENGCHLELYTLETDSGPVDWRMLSRITSCEAGGIEIQVFAGDAHGFEVCNILIPEQQGLEGVKTSTEGTFGFHDLKLGVDIQDQIAYTETGLCTLNEHRQGKASLSGALTMSAAEDPGGFPADLTISHTQ